MNRSDEVCTRQALLSRKHLRVTDAAQELGVSSSAVVQACKRHGVVLKGQRWHGAPSDCTGNHFAGNLLDEMTLSQFKDYQELRKSGQSQEASLILVGAIE